MRYNYYGIISTVVFINEKKKIQNLELHNHYPAYSIQFIVFINEILYKQYAVYIIQI